MQLSFPFSINIDIYDIRNFIVYGGNKDIFDFVTSSLILNNNIYLLSGPKKSGKTYLSKIWNKLKNAIFVDNIIFDYNNEDFITNIQDFIKPNQRYIFENIESVETKEEKLLYLINTIIQKNAILLITSEKYINDFEFKIKDLNSRFHNIFNFILKEIDDDSKEKIILKLLTDRQMNIDSTTLKYISRKISGNYDAITNFINNVTILVEENQIKKITINNIKNLF